MIKTAIMGYGTIGSGVAEVLEQNKDVIAKQVGQEVELKYVLDLRAFPDSPVADRIVHDFKVIEQKRKARRGDGRHKAVNSKKERPTLALCFAR